MVATENSVNPDEYENLRDALLDAFGWEGIRNIGEFLYGLAEDFLHERHLENKVSIDSTVFFYCLIDMLVDIMRLRYFHNIADISSIKYRAYAASWWLRRKPFQRKTDCSDSDLWINERFALTIMLHALDRNLFNSEAYDRAKAALAAKQAFYHLKYRNTNPQTLELFLVGLNAVK